MMSGSRAKGVLPAAAILVSLGLAGCVAYPSGYAGGYYAEYGYYYPGPADYYPGPAYYYPYPYGGFGFGFFGAHDHFHDHFDHHFHHHVHSFAFHGSAPPAVHQPFRPGVRRYAAPPSFHGGFHPSLHSGLYGSPVRPNVQRFSAPSSFHGSFHPLHSGVYGSSDRRLRD